MIQTESEIWFLFVYISTLSVTKTTCPRCLIWNDWGQIRFGIENFLGFGRVVQCIYRVLRNMSSGSGAGPRPDQTCYYFCSETYEYSH